MSQSSVFIPYKEKKPKLVEVKGHNLLIIGNNPEHLRDGLELIGADKVKKVTFRSEFEQGLANLAKKNKCEIVISPPEANMQEILVHLHDLLPWMQ